MQIKYDKILGKIREEDTSSGSVSIPQYDADPVSPSAEDAWVRKSTTGGGAGVGEAYGLLLTLTQPGAGAGSTYEFSYRTQEGTTVRVELA